MVSLKAFSFDNILQNPLPESNIPMYSEAEHSSVSILLDRYLFNKFTL